MPHAIPPSIRRLTLLTVLPFVTWNVPVPAQAPERIGAFSLHERGNPQTGAMVPYAVSSPLNRDPPNEGALILRCGAGGPDVVLAAGAILGTDKPVPVQYRLDDDPESERERWSLGRDGMRAIRSGGAAGAFLARAVHAEELWIRAWDILGFSRDYVFRLEGLEETLHRVASQCSAVI